MSLSEQLQRVDGGQIAALKALIQKYGGTVPEGTKIDGYANIINGLGIYSQQEMLSDETVEALGDLMQPTTPENPVPNDALKALAGFVNGNSYFRRTLLNTYTSDGSEGISVSFDGLDPKKKYYLLCEPMSDEGLSSSIGISGAASSGIYRYSLIHTTGQISKETSLRINGYSPIQIDFRVSGYTNGKITAILLTYLNTYNSFLNMLSANGSASGPLTGITFSNSLAIKISLYMEE